MFLVTTALEDFWDTSKDIVFLGEWCRRYSRRTIWEPKGGEVIPYQWRNPQRFHKEYQYVNDLYERLLPLLGNLLNSIHEKKHGPRYWRIMLGPWLYDYIGILYDRYTSLRAALDLYPDLTTIGLSKECFVIPYDTLDFPLLCSDDPYNLQLYTKILTLFGKDVEKKGFEVRYKRILRSQRTSWLKTKLKQLARDTINLPHHFGRKRRGVFLVGSYFSRSVELKLFLKTAAIVSVYQNKPVEVTFKQPDDAARLKLQQLKLKTSEFETILTTLLPFDIPQSFMESYRDIVNEVKRSYPAPPKAILCIGKLYYDEAFKHWAASCAEAGTKLLVFQHGGNYGIASYVYGEKHEMMVADRFYTWGFENGDYGSKVIPMPASNFVGRRAMGNQGNKKGVLMATGAMARYFLRITPIENHMHDCVNSWWRFVSALSPKIQTKMRVRLYKKDFGGDIVDQWKDCYPEIPIESWDAPFLESLENCRLFVCDHLSTVYAEALVANKPTILYWDPQIYIIRKSAMPFFDDLRSAGILHYTPESAALAVNSAYDDVKKWWNEPVRQAARSKFCNRFARTAPNAVAEWGKQLRQMAK